MVKLSPPPIEQAHQAENKMFVQVWNDWFRDIRQRVNTTISTAVTTFLGLTDTPSSYSGDGGKLVRVNVSENALEFISSVTLVTGTTNEIEITDLGNGLIQIGLPDDVTITNDLTVGNDVNVGGDIYIEEDNRIYYDA